MARERTTSKFSERIEAKVPDPDQIETKDEPPTVGENTSDEQDQEEDGDAQ